MDLLSDMRAAVRSDLTVGSESAFFDQTTIDLAINRAYRKVGGMFRWPELEDAKKTSTIANQEYYDYPTNWRPNSIWKLVVDDIDYGDPLVFKDYLYEKEEDRPSGLDYMWANQWRWFFMYPTPTANGSNNISVWGVKVVSSLSSDSSTTIFSYSMPEVNEAIVLEAHAILRVKGEDGKVSEMLSTEAKQIVVIAWNKIASEMKKYEKTQPMFNVPDLFQKRGQKQDTGRFNI